MRFVFESECNLGYGCDYSANTLVFSGAVELTEEEVQCLVDLVRGSGGETDVEAIGLRARFPDIFDKLDYAFYEASREALYRYWLLEGFENGDYDQPDDFAEALEAAGLFKYEHDLEAIREEMGLEDDDEIDEDILEDCRTEALDKWLSEYYDSLDEDGKVAFIETFYGDVVSLDALGVEYTVEIPWEIVELANGKDESE